MAGKKNKGNKSDEEVYEVEKILEKRVRGGKIEHLVKWVGWQEPTWEKLGKNDCPVLMEEFENGLVEKENNARTSKSIILSPPLKSKQSRKRKSDSVEPNKKLRRARIEEDSEDDSSKPSTSRQSTASAKSKDSSSNRQPLRAKTTRKSSRSHTSSITRSGLNATTSKKSNKKAESSAFPEVSSESSEESIILDKKITKKGKEKSGNRKEETKKSKKVNIPEVITLDGENSQSPHTQEVPLSTSRAPSPNPSLDSSSNLFIDEASQPRDDSETPAIVDEDTSEKNVKSTLSPKLKSIADNMNFFETESVDLVRLLAEEIPKETVPIDDQTLNSTYQLVINDSFEVSIIPEEAVEDVAQEESSALTVNEMADQTLTIEDAEPEIEKSNESEIVENESEIVEKSNEPEVEQSNEPEVEQLNEHEVEKSNEPEVVEKSNEPEVEQSNESEKSNEDEPDIVEQSSEDEPEKSNEDEPDIVEQSSEDEPEQSNEDEPVQETAITSAEDQVNKENLPAPVDKPDEFEQMEDEVPPSDENSNTSSTSVPFRLPTEPEDEIPVLTTSTTNIFEFTRIMTPAYNATPFTIPTSEKQSVSKKIIENNVENAVENNLEDNLEANVENSVEEEDEILILNVFENDESMESDQIPSSSNDISQSPVFDLPSLSQMQSITNEALKEYWKRHALKKVMTTLENPKNYINPFDQHKECKIEKFGSIFKVIEKCYVMCKFVGIEEELAARIEDVRKSDHNYELSLHFFQCQQRKHKVIMY